MLSKLFVAAAGILAVASNALYADVIIGPVINPANGHRYYLLGQDSWTNSEVSAQNLGGHLATINDAAEQSWVFSTFGSVGGIDRDLWIGLSDPTHDASGGNHADNFVWAGGDAGSSYRNWAPGEPNDQGAAEFYVYMWKSNATRDLPAGTWNDVVNTPYDGTYGAEPNVVPFGAVVEVVPEPATGAAVAGTLLILLRRRADR